MTTSDGWTAAVRERLAPGRLLPLGTAAGAWLAERAAREVLGRAAAGVRGAVPGSVRIGAAAEPDLPDPPFPVPPGGLPPGPLRIDAEFAAVAHGRPLPETAEEVRAVLLAAAAELGLTVTEADLRVTDLLEEAPAAEAAPAAAHTAPATDDPVALAVLLVPGVAAVTDALGPPVLRTQGAVRVEFAVAADHPPAEVARAARAAAAAEAPADAAVTVLITEVRPAVPS
ncbi:hypothetical protein ACFQ8C_13115 [Streptomyces sp. NPDC056503]|uniref:hypothetical protein n=1 Tax=Streptomyces sp. NPDC056503 TaxID=3345842 RepID=UPI0036B9CDCD